MQHATASRRKRHREPLVRRLPGFLQDSKHVLRLMEQVIWKPDYIWCTLDVQSLYSSIPHRLGLEAVQYHLENYAAYSAEHCNLILEALWYLLRHNYFYFDGVYYLQGCGVSMGAPFPPTLANLFMAW